MSLRTKKESYSDWASLGFSGDENTGVHSTAADTVSLRGGGTDLVAADSTGTFISGGIRLGHNTPGAASSYRSFVKKVTDIAENTATDILTVTAPNVALSGLVKLTILATMSGVSTTYESSRCATGNVVVTRVAGAAVVGAASTLAQTQIATSAGGATITLAYGVSSVTGAVGASNSFTIQVTVDASAGSPTHSVMVLVEVFNMETGGITVA